MGLKKGVVTLKRVKNYIGWCMCMGCGNTCADGSSRRKGRFVASKVARSSFPRRGSKFLHSIAARLFRCVAYGASKCGCVRGVARGRIPHRQRKTALKLRPDRSLVSGVCRSRFVWLASSLRGWEPLVWLPGRQLTENVASSWRSERQVVQLSDPKDGKNLPPWVRRFFFCRSSGEGFVRTKV